MSSYGRNPFAIGRALTPAVRGLLIGTVAAYVLQVFVERYTNFPIGDYVALSVESFLKLRVWTFFTYLFLHGNPLHLVLNMLTLYMLGPAVEQALGRGRFLWLYFISGVLGGAGWLVLTDNPYTVCIGASGAIFGVMAAFGTLFPRTPLTVLVFYILPVTLQAWVMVSLLALIQVFMLRAPGDSHVAYSAHLAGALVGFMAALFFRRGFSWNPLRKRPRRTPVVDAAEVDRILTKVAREGIHRLSNRERETLRMASERMRSTNR